VRQNYVPAGNEWVETVVTTGMVLTGVPLEVLKKATEGKITIYFFFPFFQTFAVF
jgi:hypothetical protein